MAPEGTAGLDAYLAGERTRIDDALDRLLPPFGTSPPVLHEAMRYTLLLPGKRMRGIVLLAVSDLFRRRGEGVVALAGAVEMVHAASLILDDLPCMDDASSRRGKPVLHRALGEANAVLAAVALLNRAFATVAESAELRDRTRLAAIAQLAEAIGADGLIGGQVQDLAAAGRRPDLEELEWIHSHKTGALFIAAAQIGGLAGGARPKAMDRLLRFAKNLGLAFQITDDLLDYSGDPAQTGKDAGQDRDRATFVDLCGIEGARRLADELVDAAVAALLPFGKRAAVLRSIAEFVRVRDR